MRRCKEPSCPFVGVLLLMLGGVACQDIKTPETNCYYEENGVTKSCEIFKKVECKNMGSYRVPDCSWDLKEGAIDGPAYYNATFSLWASKGYFAMKEADECWQFQAGGRRYPEECVLVKFFYVPDRNGTDMSVWGDRAHCRYLHKNSTYVMQLHRDTNETFKVRFGFQTLSEIRQLHLMLVGGECEVSCDGRENECSVSLEERIMTNTSATEVFTGLRQGYYCMRVNHGDCAVHTSTIRAVTDNSFSQGQVKQKPHTGGKSKIPRKLKRKEEHNQHSPPHSIITKSPPRSSNPRKTGTYHTRITNQNHYSVYNHNLHTILTILTDSTGLALAYNIQRY